MTLPLAGRGILVTRPEHQAEGLARHIEEAGGTAIRFPALEIVAVESERLVPQLARLVGVEHAIFVSPNAAQFGMARVRASDTALPASVIAVGQGTARALQAAGVAEVIAPPASSSQDSEALLALPQLQHVAGQRIAIFRGLGGRELIADTLRERGAEVEYVECYRRQCPRQDANALLARWAAGGVDAVTVASGETLRNLMALLGEPGVSRLVHTPLFVPHEKIAAAAKRLGIYQVIATLAGDAGLVAGLVNWFGKPQ